MNVPINDHLRKAMRLMQAGDLNAATAAIQSGLAGRTERSALDGDYIVIDEVRIDGPSAAVGDPAASVQNEDADAPGAGFHRRSFTCAAGTREYRLFVPTSYNGKPLPLIVMLHGCTQTAEDFARGTRMNALAEQHGCLVAYPAQPKAHNGNNCWSWFRPSDQIRERGEPSILAGIARAIGGEFSVDTTRVYAAGLSAGGAMAVILGSTYPDVFAAIGVHSGLPYAAAHDVPSAFAAMHGQPAPSLPRAPSRAAIPLAAVPVIVFHGDRDTTVVPANGDRIARQMLDRLDPAASATAGEPLRQSVEHGRSPGGRGFTRTAYADGTGLVLAETWVIHGAGHAWSGGDPRGSYTDPSGPDASAEMLRFFLATRPTPS